MTGPAFLRLALCVAVVFPTGCRSTGGAPEISRVRELPAVRLVARESADRSRLTLRMRLEGRDAWAAADMPGPDAPALARGYAVLKFGGRRESEAVIPTGRRAGRPRRVPVLETTVWRQAVDALAEQLAPPEANRGALLMAAGHEVVAHRVDGRAIFTPLARRPARLRVVGKHNAADLVERLCGDDAPPALLAHQGPVLLRTGAYPEFVYLDRSRRRFVFLALAAPETATVPLIPSELTLRQMISLSLRSGALAILSNPFSTVSRGAASARSIAGAAVRHFTATLPSDPPPPLSPAPRGMDLDEWERLLDTFAPPRSKAALRFRVGGEAFFPEFIQAVQDARRSVDIQLYIFDNDDYAVQIADLLRERSREVRVRVLMDEVASLQAAASPPDSPMPADFVAPKNMVSYLRQGVPLQVRPMPMTGLTASHTKIILVDGERAWLGGMNIGREYRYDWHDMMIEVRGPLIAALRRDFSRAWAHAGLGGDYAALWRRLTRDDSSPPERKIPAPPGAIPVRPLYTAPWRHEIARAHLEGVRRARQRVYLQNAYLTDIELIRELILARHRGVDVRVILPDKNDNAIMAENVRLLIPLLSRHGVRVFVYPGMSHVKAALIDGWACAGSANYDRLSLRVNNECNIAFSDPAAVAELERVLFEPDFRRCKEFTGDPGPPPANFDAFYHSLIQAMAGQL